MRLYHRTILPSNAFEAKAKKQLDRGILTGVEAAMSIFQDDITQDLWAVIEKVRSWESPTYFVGTKKELETIPLKGKMHPGPTDGVFVYVLDKSVTPEEELAAFPLD